MDLHQALVLASRPIGLVENYQPCTLSHSMGLFFKDIIVFFKKQSNPTQEKVQKKIASFVTTKSGKTHSKYAYVVQKKEK